MAALAAALVLACLPSAWMIAELENVARGKEATSSSAYYEWGPSYAVDGDTRQIPRWDDSWGRTNAYYCFHSDVGETGSWWSVDLGAVFPMNNIVIYYRKKYVKRFTGAKIYIRNNTGLEVQCAHISDTTQYPDAVIRLQCDRPAQKLVIRQTEACKKCDDAACTGCYLELCEVQVLVCPAGTIGPNCTECPKGSYGQDCSGQCGQCRDGARCHHVNGSCPRGECQPGYRGDRCDQEVAGKDLRGGKGDVGGTLVGGAVTALVATLAAVIVLVLFLRRRHGPGTVCFERKRENAQSLGQDGGNGGEMNIYAKVACRRDSTSTGTDEESEVEEAETLDDASPDYVNMPSLPGVAEIASPSCMPTGDLEQLIAAKKAKGNLAKEYKSVPTSYLAEHSVAQEKEHAQKNKFKGYHPYDCNRVVLEPTATDPDSHYINASFVDGFKKERMFIAAQAPTHETLPDFLRMIWQQRCSHVVMLTNLVEDSKVKCERYWPETEGEDLRCGEVTVTLTGTTEWSYCTLRLLTLTHQSGASVRVKQFHFTTWPDHGVPTHVDMLDFFWKVRASWTADSGPLLVHCSAGVGRTGTFIALCVLSDQAASQHRVDPLATLTALRHQRRNMIQTLSQYEFLHEALVRVVQLGRTAVAREDFCSKAAGLLVVGHRSLDQLALDIATYTTSDAINEEDAHVYSNSKWNYFTATKFVSSVRVKQGLLMVKLWESGTEAEAPKGLWNFLLDTPTFALVDLHHDKVGCVRAPQGEAEAREGATSVKWRVASLLAPGVYTRELLLQCKGRQDKKLEYIGYDASSAVMPGSVATVATRLTSQQLSSELPLVCMYRASEESCAQLLCAAVNLTQSLRLDGHVDLVSSLLRLQCCLDPSLVTSLADVAYAVCQEDGSLYANS